MTARTTPASPGQKTLISLKNLAHYRIVTEEGEHLSVDGICFSDRSLRNHLLVSVAKDPDPTGSTLGVRLFDTKGIVGIDHDRKELMIDNVPGSEVSVTIKNPVMGSNDQTMPGDVGSILKGFIPVSETLQQAVALHEIQGFDVVARDGRVGHCIDVLVLDTLWRTEHLVVDTESLWYPSNRSMVPVSAVKGIDWNTGKIMVDLMSDTIMDLPDYSPDLIVQGYVSDVPAEAPQRTGGEP